MKNGMNRKMLLLKEFQHGFCAGADVELLIDVSEMLANGLGADKELLGYLLVTIAFGYTGEYLTFSLGKVLDFL